jgi:hypothetical protein
MWEPHVHNLGRMSLFPNGDHQFQAASAIAVIAKIIHQHRSPHTRNEAMLFASTSGFSSAT